jgi:hypothetical protein
MQVWAGVVVVGFYSAPLCMHALISFGEWNGDCCRHWLGCVIYLGNQGVIIRVLDRGDDLCMTGEQILLGSLVLQWHK